MESKIAHTLIGGGKKANRKDCDFYPTPNEVTIALMDFFIEINLKITSVWEPACGDGAMSKIIEKYGADVYSTDLRIDNGYGAGGLDFLTHRDIGAHAIITNPPFNLSSMFIQKAVNISPIVAMVLKSQYWHAAKRLPLFNNQPPTYILPLTWRPDFSFGEDGDSPLMDVIWTVWIKGDCITKYIPLKKPKPQFELF